MDTIAQRLRWLRELRGMTQEELANRAGVTKDTIVQIEVGRSSRPRQLPEIAKVLDASPGWLAFGENKFDRLTPTDLDRALRIRDLPPHLQAAIDAIAYGDHDKKDNGKPL